MKKKKMKKLLNKVVRKVAKLKTKLNKKVPVISAKRDGEKAWAEGVARGIDESGI